MRTLYQVVAEKYPEIVSKRLWTYRVHAPVSLDDEASISIYLAFANERNDGIQSDVRITLKIS